MILNSKQARNRGSVCIALLSSMSDRTVREEELMIEVERLRAWLYKIKNEAWKETKHAVIEWLAEQSLVRDHCVTHPNWGSTEDWAKLGVWPPARIEEPTVAPPENCAG